MEDTISTEMGAARPSEDFSEKKKKKMQPLLLFELGLLCTALGGLGGEAVPCTDRVHVLGICSMAQCVLFTEP